MRTDQFCKTNIESSTRELQQAATTLLLYHFIGSGFCSSGEDGYALQIRDALVVMMVMELPLSLLGTAYA